MIPNFRELTLGKQVLPFGANHCKTRIGSAAPKKVLKLVAMQIIQSPSPLKKNTFHKPPSSASLSYLHRSLPPFCKRKTCIKDFKEKAS